jgi:hypothetical protein
MDTFPGINLQEGSKQSTNSGESNDRWSVRTNSSVAGDIKRTTSCSGASIAALLVAVDKVTVELAFVVVVGTWLVVALTASVVKNEALRCSESLPVLGHCI